MNKIIYLYKKNKAKTSEVDKLVLSIGDVIEQKDNYVSYSMGRLKATYFLSEDEYMSEEVLEKAKEAS